MRQERLNLNASCKKYKTINSTVNLGKKVGVIITAHCVEYNKRGKISVHWLWDGREWVRNQILKCRLHHMLDTQRNINPISGS